MPCDSSDCNNHGICIGTKKLPICICYMPYIGKNCAQNALETGEFICHLWGFLFYLEKKLPAIIIQIINL